MHMHSCLDGNDLIVGFDIGSRSQSGWPFCIGARLRAEAGTQAARSKLRDTVTNRCFMLRRSSRSISESHHSPALRPTRVLKLCNYLGGSGARLMWAVTSSLTLGRDPQAGGPLLCSRSSHFLNVSLSLLYYLMTVTHSSVCNSCMSRL